MFLSRTTTSAHLVAIDHIIEIPVEYLIDIRLSTIYNLLSTNASVREEDLWKLFRVKFDGVVNLSTFWYDWESSVNETIKKLETAIPPYKILKEESNKKYEHYRERFFTFVDHGVRGGQYRERKEVIKQHRRYLEEHHSYQSNLNIMERTLEGLKEQSNKPYSFLAIKPASSN